MKPEMIARWPKEDCGKRLLGFRVRVGVRVRVRV
jgi:hypothetical protein